MKKSRFLIDDTPGALFREYPDNDHVASGKIKLDPGFSLNLRSLPGRVYRVSVEYPQSDTQVNYEISVKGRGARQNRTEFSFQKQNFYVNEETPDLVVDELDIFTVQTLYPLDINIDYLSRKQKITNLGQVQERWNELKPFLNREYGGYLLDNYVRQIETSLKDPDLFIRILVNNDLFFSLYFHSLYGTYSTRFERNEKISLNPGIYNQPLTFSGKQWIEEEYNTMEGIYVYFHGLAEKDDCKYELKIKYNLHFKTFTIKDIVAEVKQVSGEEKVPIVRINIWQLRKEEPKVDYEKQQQAERLKQEENEEQYQQYLKNKGKSWFDKLFGF